MSVQSDCVCFCTREALVGRARLYQSLRSFFENRAVLEVETPILCQRSVTDPMLAVFQSRYEPAGVETPHRPLYLQTSPEFAMKRLLASGVGSMFQITKAFRNGEVGRHHNPEFTLLEWYRVGFDLEDLQDEIEMLLVAIAEAFGLKFSVARTTYCALFEKHLGVHPLDASLDMLAGLADSAGLDDAPLLCGDNRGLWLDFLFSCLIQPALPVNCLTQVSRYPAILPSLARKVPDDERWVERVELFLGGMELGNGFYELTDPIEQEQRFRSDLEVRQREGLELPELDERLLAALRLGVPDCAGMAIGLDRLLMILLGASSIDDVLAFPIHRA